MERSSRRFYFFLVASIICSHIKNVRGCFDVEEAFKGQNIVPDVVNTAPRKLLKVTYRDTEILLGTKLTPTQAGGKPDVSYPHDSTSFYTLCLTDPDVPTSQNPTSAQFKHWLVGNIRGQDLQTGTTLASYMKPAPPKGSDYHRYTFLVYKQPSGGIDFDQEDTKKKRTEFSIQDFAEKHHLGAPIAGNFFLSKSHD